MAISNNPNDPTGPGPTPTPTTPTPGFTPLPSIPLHPHPPHAGPPRHRVVVPSPPVGGGGGPGPHVDDTPAISSKTTITPQVIAIQGPSRTDVFVPVNEPLPIVYGSVHMGAQIWYDKVESDGARVVLYALCHGPVNSVAVSSIDGQTIAGIGATANIYTGTAGQGVDPIGSGYEAALWTSAFPYIAYVVVKFARPDATHPALNVRSAFFDVQGMLVRDPRTDPTLVNRYYRDNPALVLADFLSSPVHNDANGNPYTYGAKIADANLDWSGSITTAANNCDTLLADGITKRFTIGVVMSDKKSIGEWVTFLRSHAQLMEPIFNNGLYQIVMDNTQAASGITLTDQGTAANIISAGSLVVAGSNQTPTRVFVNYTDTSSQFKRDQVYDDDPGLAGGTVELVERTYDLPGIPSHDQAARIARYLRKRAAQDKSATIRVNAEGLQLLPGIVVSVTSQQLNWANQLCIVTDLRSVTELASQSAWDMRVELYNAAVYDDTQATASASAPPASPSPYDPPPEVTDTTVSIGSAGEITLTFNAPKIRSTNQYGASSWSQANCGGFVAANVNDGNLTTSCFDWTPAADSTATLDAGSAKTFQEVTITYSAYVSDPKVEYSDDNLSWIGSWPGVFAMKATNVAGGTTTVKYRLFGGAHRYWRVRKNSSASIAQTFTEIQFTEFTANDYLFAGKYNVWDLRQPSRRLFKTVPSPPTSSAPLLIDSMVTRTANDWNSLISVFASYSVTVASLGGPESYGYNLPQFNGAVVNTTAAQNPFIYAGVTASAPFVQQKQGADVTLANGANGTVTLTAGATLQKVVGPTAAFSVGGVSLGSAPAGGTVARIVYSGTQVFTLINEDAGQTAANRITTLTGGSLARTGPCFFEFEYDTDTSRWILKTGWPLLASGDVPDSALSPNVALLNRNSQSFTGTPQLFANGSAAAPSIAFANSVTTGLFRAGADILGFATAGAERVRIDASGNVGIGTTQFTSASGELVIPYGKYLRSVRSVLDDTRRLIGFDTIGGAINQVSIAPDGNNVNVGIGTTGPASQLNVQGVIADTDGRHTLTLIDASALAANIGPGIHFSTTYLASTSNFASIELRRETAITDNLSGALIFSTRPATGNVTERARITSNGYVGIGTTVPGFPLVVEKDAIAATPTTSAQLQNATLSTSIATQQFSPSLQFTGHAWNTTVTAADNQMDARQYLSVTSGLTPSSTLTWGFQRAAGGYTDQMALTSGGQLQMADGTTSAPAFSFIGETGTGVYRASAGRVGFAISGAEYAALIAGQFQVGDGSATAPGWSFRNQTGMGMYRGGVNILGIATAGLQAIKIDATQNVTTYGATLITGTDSTTVSQNFQIRAGSGINAYPELDFFRGGVLKAYVAVPPSNIHVITGDAADDMDIISVQAINFSANSGTTKHHKIDSAGAHTYTAASGTSTAHLYTGTTNGYHAIRMQNTSGDLFIGVADSTGTATLGGATAYAGIINVIANLPLHFATNNILALTIKPGGDIDTVGKISKYNNLTTDGLGVTAVLKNIARTVQTASIVLTDILTTAAIGNYRVNVYLVTTTAGTGGTVTASILWSDGSGSQTVTTPTVSLSALGAYYSTDVVIRNTSNSSIQYSTTVTGAIGSPQYALYLIAERVS